MRLEAANRIDSSKLREEFDYFLAVNLCYCRRSPVDARVLRGYEIVYRICQSQWITKRFDAVVLVIKTFGSCIPSIETVAIE